MKGNNGKGNTIDRDEWETPKWLFNILNEQYRFTVDCCATKENTKVKYFSSNLESEFLYPPNDKVLYGICWMNPPFSKSNKMFKAFLENISKGVAIFRCDNMETMTWQNIIFKYVDWVFIPNKRICYEGLKGKGSRFPSALIGFGVEPPKNIEGTLLRLDK